MLEVARVVGKNRQAVAAENARIAALNNKRL